MQDLMETGALTKSSEDFGKFLSHLLNQEQQYIEFLRDGRKRAFFITSHSVVGTVRKPYIPERSSDSDAFRGGGLYRRNKRRKKPRRGNRPGRDGRTSTQRLRDIQRIRAERIKASGGTTKPTSSLLRNTRSLKFGARANAITNTLFAGIEFAGRIQEGQSLTKATIGTGASVAGGIAGGALGTKIGIIVGGAIGSLGFGIGAVPGAAIGGFIGGVIGSMLGSTAASGVADYGSDLVGLKPGGVLKSPVRSVIAEAGQPETLIPFDLIGKTLINLAFKPIGSLMVGAAEGLLAVLPTSDSTSKMKITLGRLKRTFGSEKMVPAIRGAAGGVTVLKNGLENVMGMGFDFITSIFLSSGQARARSRGNQQTRNTSPATGVIKNFNLSQQEAFKKIYDLAVADGRAEFPELVAAIAMHETGFLQTVGGNNPFNQRPAPGDGYASSQGFIDYASLEEAVAHHISLWHLTDRYGDNFNSYSDPNKAFAALAYTYAPPADGNDPESYKQSVADIIATMLPIVQGNPPNPKNLTVPPNNNNKLLSPDRFYKIAATLRKWNQSPKSYVGNNPIRIAGVGTVLVGTGPWPMNSPIVKYFNENGEQIEEKKWIKLLEKVIPDEVKGQPTANQVFNQGPNTPGYGKGGSFDSSMSRPSTQPKVNQDPEMLNVPAIKRDYVAMEKVEESITFLPIVLPGPVIPVESIVEKIVTKNDISYFDPFSHGVKRGERIVV